jgi:hypothetical protein
MRPERHLGWPVFRVLFAVAGLLTWLPRAAHLTETYSSAGIVIAAGRVPLAETAVWSPTTAWALWGATVLGLLLVGAGRLVRVGLLLFALAACALMFEEGLNMKAYDRLMLWQAFALLLAPAAAARVQDGSPVARYTLTLTYCGLYGMTGWNKILEEPLWWRGVPLAYDLVERNFGGKPLGIWLSGHIWMLAPMCWLTLIFEAGFPLLVWVRRVNPWLLALGAFFHAMTVLTLHVNTFGLVATAAYPVLLFPERAEALIIWARRRFSRGG